MRPAEASSSAPRPLPARLPVDVERVRVVWLHGSSRERGRMPGEAQRTARKGAPERFRFCEKFVHHVVRTHLPGAPRPAWENAARLVYDEMVAPIARGLSPRLGEARDGFSEGLGSVDLEPFIAPLPAREAMRLLHAMYDGVNVLFGLPLGPRAPYGSFSCSSLVLLPRATKSSALLHGRNFDLPSLGDASAPLLAVHRPDDGLAHVSLHHGGGFVAGMTATHEAKLNLEVQQGHSRAVSPRGEAVLDLALEAIERCRTPSEALDLMRRRKSAAGWLFVLSDANAGRAAVVLLNAKGYVGLFLFALFSGRLEATGFLPAACADDAPFCRSLEHASEAGHLLFAHEDVEHVLDRRKEAAEADLTRGFSPSAAARLQVDCILGDVAN